MVFIKEKAIKGHKYYYLTKNIRLADGRFKTIQKLVKDKNKPLKELEAEFKDFFIQKEKELFQGFALNKYKSDLIFSEQEIKKIEDIKVEYGYTVKKFSKSQFKDVFDRFIANFTYESNAIEGNSLTLKDVSIIMFENRSLENKDLREVFETKNSRKVMEKLIRGKFKIEERDIIKIHKMLMENIDERIGYKQFPNEILGSDVELTPPEKVKEEIQELIAWYKKNIEILPTLKVSALFHGKFERIHPFADGNGRVGRFLANLSLMEQGYPPIIIRKTQRQAYIKCLEDFQGGYPENLERFFLEKYKTTYRKFFAKYLEYIR